MRNHHLSVESKSSSQQTSTRLDENTDGPTQKKQKFGHILPQKTPCTTTLLLACSFPQLDHPTSRYILGFMCRFGERDTILTLPEQFTLNESHNHIKEVTKLARLNKTFNTLITNQHSFWSSAVRKFNFEVNAIDRDQKAINRKNAYPAVWMFNKLNNPKLLPEGISTTKYLTGNVKLIETSSFDYCREEPDNALFLLAINGNIETFTALNQKYKLLQNVQKQKSQQLDVICTAAACGHLALVKLLLTLCNCTTREAFIDRYCCYTQETPLSYAARYNRLSVVKYFVEELQYDLHIGVELTKGFTYINALTPLINALKKDSHLETIIYFLNIDREKNCIPLDIKAELLIKALKIGHRSLVHLLLTEYNIHPTTLSNKYSIRSASPLSAIIADKTLLKFVLMRCKFSPEQRGFAQRHLTAVDEFSNSHNANSALSFAKALEEIDAEAKSDTSLVQRLTP